MRDTKRIRELLSVKGANLTRLLSTGDALPRRDAVKERVKLGNAHRSLFGVVERLSKVTDAVVVAFSGGKDSIVVLDLCLRHFKRVEVFFMYMVPNLSFQEHYLSAVESKYGLKISRYPHWANTEDYRHATYRPPNSGSLDCPKLKFKDMEFEWRRITGVEWIATGEKMRDSLERRSILKPIDGIDVRFRRVYPVCYWSNKQLWAYIKARKLLVPPDYGMFRSSFSKLTYEYLAPIKERYPSDFKKIAEVFPYVEAVIEREKFRGQ